MNVMADHDHGTEESTSSSPTPPTPQWDPVQQIYVGGVVPENAQVQALLQKNNGFLRLFGYGSLCWNPGTGALAKPGVVGTLGRARGYKRCWAQKSTDHRGRPAFPGIVCTLLEDGEVAEISSTPLSEPTMTEGVLYLIPPELVKECLEELDFREKGGYARDVIEVVEDETGETYQAVLYRGTPDNPAFWPRALLDLPLAAAIMSVSEGPSGKNDVYLNSLDRFLSDTHTIAAENDDTTSLASMARYFQTKSQLYFLFGSGSNQHNQLLLDRPISNAAMLNTNGEDAHEQKEIVLCTPAGSSNLEDNPIQLYAGGGHSGLLSESGKLYLWGWNGDGQCGNCVSGEKAEESPLPVVQPLSGLAVGSVALGFSHTLVLEKGTGKVYAFGSNERGQVAGTPSAPDGSTSLHDTPKTPEFLTSVQATAVAAGLFHSAVLTNSGELITFGCSQFGQSLPTSSNDEETVAGRWKPSDGSRLVGVACGRRHTVVVDEHGRIWTMGENKYGQLGRPILDGKKFDATATLVEGIPAFSADSNKIRIECGWSHTVVHVQTPTGGSLVYGWGRNDMGQLGLGTKENVLSPRRIFSKHAVSSVACGSEFTMLVDKENRIWGVGWNEQ
jgi:alpha-tubulin suppressor-like RCC1 family protein/cation transport regulator ChaC